MSAEGERSALALAMPPMLALPETLHHDQISHLGLIAAKMAAREILRGNIVAYDGSYCAVIPDGGSGIRFGVLFQETPDSDVLVIALPESPQRRHRLMQASSDVPAGIGK